MEWSQGDTIVVVHDGSIYRYATKTGGRTSKFYAIDEDNTLKSVDPSKPVSAFFKMKDVATDGTATLSIPKDQKEQVRPPLYAYHNAPEVSDNALKLTFAPASSILELSVTTQTEIFADAVRLTPLGCNSGFITLSSGSFSPATGKVVGGQITPVTLKFTSAAGLSAGKTCQILLGNFKMNYKGMKVEYLMGDKTVFTKNIWENKDIDFETERICYSQRVSGSTLGMEVRSDHPRLFLNADDLPAVKANAEGPMAAQLSKMKARIDAILDKPIEFPDPLAASGESNTNHEYGFRASEAAMLWLMTGQPNYLEFTKKLLTELAGYYRMRCDNNLNIHWYAFSQICTLCAWDWVYNDLDPAERKEIGDKLYDAIYDVAWHVPSDRSARYRENVSFVNVGTYGTPCLPWYISIAFWGDGYDDEACEKMFESGYSQNIEMTQYRSGIVGTEAGAVTGCPNYSLSTYPIADFNFIRSLKAATGKDISEEIIYVFKYLDYIDLNRLPGNREFGFGDTNHYYCTLQTTDINYNLREIASIYSGRHPEVLPEVARLLNLFNSSRSIERFPFMPILQFYDLPAPSSSSTQPDAIYLKNMGQAFMRSGVGDNDTYAEFTSGGSNTEHKHYDNNNFVIYKYGYRALDTGTRPEPGLHLSHYYSRTVAHNCVTIRMSGETMPKYWGSAAPEENASTPVPNDGGQNNLLSSTVEKFVNTKEYTSISSDATASYNSSKASQVEREFLWFKPDVFVVFDRVVSKRASYPKAWLLHFATEPVVEGNEISEASDGGKLICRTLYPADAVYEKIGGPGKQFWSDGKNWPLPANVSSTIPPSDWPQLGQWRVEVKPGAERTADYFLHIIQVGSIALSSVPAASVKEEGNNIIMEFKYRRTNWRITFDKTARYGNTIETFTPEIIDGPTESGSTISDYNLQIGTEE